MPPFHICLLAMSFLQGLILAAHEGLEGRPFHVAETASAVLAVFQQIDTTLDAEISRVPAPQLCQGPPDEDDLRCTANAGDGWLHRKPDLRAPDSDSPEDHRDRREQEPLNCSDYTIRRMLIVPPNELHHQRMTRACGHLDGTLDMLSPACSLGPRMLDWMDILLHAQDDDPPEVHQARRKTKPQVPHGYTTHRTRNDPIAKECPADNGEEDEMILMQASGHDLRQTFHDWKVDRMTELESLFERNLARNMAFGLDRAINDGLAPGSQPLRTLRRFASSECGIFWELLADQDEDDSEDKPLHPEAETWIRAVVEGLRQYQSSFAEHATHEIPSHPPGAHPPTVEPTPTAGPVRGHDFRTCGWRRSALGQLHQLQRLGHGREDALVQVIRRLAYRNVPGYFAWAKHYLRPLRGEFGPTYQHHIYPDELHEDDLDWANRVEEATWQDFVHATRVEHGASSSSMLDPRRSRSPARATSSRRHANSRGGGDDASLMDVAGERSDRRHSRRRHARDEGRDRGRNRTGDSHARLRTRSSREDRRPVPHLDRPRITSEVRRLVPRPKARTEEARDRNIYATLTARAESSSARPSSSSALHVADLNDAVDMWRHLLGFHECGPQGLRIADGHNLLGPSREVQIVAVLRAMTTQQQVWMTLGFVSLLRMLMAEIAELSHQGSLVEVELNATEEEEGDLGSHVQTTSPKAATRQPQVDSWAALMLKLQKELAGQCKSLRHASVAALRSRLIAAVSLWKDGGQEDQLLALLAAMDDTKVQGKITEDSLWVERWGKTLSEHIPGMEIAVRVIHVESQDVTFPTDRELDQLLEDEEEARQAREERQMQQEAEEAARCLEEEKHLAQAELAWHAHQAARLQDWEDWAVHDEMYGIPEPPQKRTRKVCRLTMEVASGSTDVPRVAYAHTFDIPEDGELNFRMVARMEDSPADVEVPTTPATIPTTGPLPTGDAVGLEPADPGAPSDVDLDFDMYQVAYGEWESGAMTDQEVHNKYGRDVLLMMQAQFATAGKPEAADGVPRQLPTPNLENNLNRGFGRFESAYGRWKEGTDSSELVLERHGPGWLQLFHKWKQHGLDYIWDELQYHVTMRDAVMDGDAETARGGEGRDTEGDPVAMTALEAITQEDVDTVPWGVPLLDAVDGMNTELERAAQKPGDTPARDDASS